MFSYFLKHNILRSIVKKDMGSFISLIAQDFSVEDSWTLLEQKDEEHNTPLMHAAVEAMANSLTSMLTFVLNRKEHDKKT